MPKNTKKMSDTKLELHICKPTPLKGIQQFVCLSVCLSVLSVRVARESRFYGLTVWNSLPSALWDKNLSLSLLKRKLELSFPNTLTRLLLLGAGHKYLLLLTYLLTYLLTLLTYLLT